MPSHTPNAKPVIPWLLHSEALRRGILCFSTASLLFLNAWVELYPGTSDQYFQNYTPSWHALGALWVNLLLLTGILFAAQSLVARSRWAKPLSLVAGVLVLAALLDPSRRLLTPVFPCLRTRGDAAGPWLHHFLPGRPGPCGIPGQCPVACP